MDLDRIRLLLDKIHQQTADRKRYGYWPVQLETCDTPNRHDMREVNTITLSGRPYTLNVITCKHCPVSIVEPVMKKGAKPDKVVATPPPPPDPEPKPKLKPKKPAPTHTDG